MLVLLHVTHMSDLDTFGCNSPRVVVFMMALCHVGGDNYVRNSLFTFLCPLNFYCKWHQSCETLETAAKNCSVFVLLFIVKPEQNKKQKQMTCRNRLSDLHGLEVELFEKRRSEMIKSLYSQERVSKRYLYNWTSCLPVWSVKSVDSWNY